LDDLKKPDVIKNTDEEIITDIKEKTIIDMKKGTATETKEEIIKDIKFGSNADKKNTLFSISNLIFLAAIVVILFLTIIFRISLLNTVGFFEPDGFYHFSVIRAAILHNFVIPKYLSISGWPQHSPVTEPDGLYWVTLIPFAILQYFGLSAYTIMRMMPLVFGILDVFATYILSRYFTKDRIFGILAMLFVALSMGDAARTSVSIYRGDGFVTFFLISTLILILEAMKHEGKSRIMFSVFSAVALSFCTLIWNGAPFSVVIIMFVFILMLFFSFISLNYELAKKSAYIIIILAIWFVLAHLYMVLGFISGQSLTGPSFLLFLAGMAISLGLVVFIIKNIDTIPILEALKNYSGRIAAAILYAILLAVAISIISPTIYSTLLFNSGFSRNTGFASTIQELQPPTPGFLFASFNIAMFATPMTIMIYLSSYFGQSATTGFITITIFYIISVLLMWPYLFMQIKDDDKDPERYLSAKPSIDFKVTIPMIILISYFAITAYLQINAVRFNSLISIPLALFVAYTLFWLLMEFKKINKYLYYVMAAVIIIALIATIFFDITSSGGIMQADNINPTFLNALAWMHNNTSPNAVVLTLWPDGSVVEGWANRTSVTDSVGSQIANKSDDFALWLLNSTPDPGFLTSNMSGKPNYLLVRYSWLSESGGIFTESGLNPNNSSKYGFLALNELNIQANATTTIFNLGSTQTPIDSRTVLSNVNGIEQESSFIVMKGGISPYSYVVMYDQSNGNYSVIKQTAFNVTNNQTLVLDYSSVPKPGANINMTEGYIFTQGLGSSNMIKFLFMCYNQNKCAWNNNAESLNLVYINSDTKIFKINYNST
jgi:asparagine N-glycosylation enzyme membrane subunit Stt3